MMKKRNRLLAVLALAGVLTACGSKKDESGLKYLSDFKAEDYVKLGEYKGVEISVAEPEVTQEALEGAISVMLSEDSKVEPVEVTGRSVKAGDSVNIDYEGKLDGVAFEGGTAQGADLIIGSGRFIGGFEAGIIGMEIGETRDLDLSFPDPYTPNPDLAGKPVVFTVKVNSIKTWELTDGYVQGLGIENCTTAEDYRGYVNDAMMEQQKESFETARLNAAVEGVAECTEFKEPPSGMVARMQETLTNNAAAYAQMYGLDTGTYVAYVYGGKADAYQETLSQQAKEMAKRYIMFSAIAKEAGIEITDKEFEETIAREAAERNYESAEAYKEAIDPEAYREYMLVEEVMDFLAENAVNNP